MEKLNFDLSELSFHGSCPNYVGDKSKKKKKNKIQIVPEEWSFDVADFMKNIILHDIPASFK